MFQKVFVYCTVNHQNYTNNVIHQCILSCIPFRRLFIYQINFASRHCFDIMCSDGYATDDMRFKAINQ